jgi:uncharacterized protein YjbJ (UPF0337 family)
MLLERWHLIRGQVRQRWGKLTEDDLARISGKTEELVGILQRRYGYGKVQAEIEINHGLKDLENSASV